MFSKVLIANRGEIACRVIKTCKRLGIATVAIYSDAEPNALHVQLADETYNVGKAAASESYLNIQRIVEVAVESGAEAIHPGYGFLSENPAFVNACEENGIRFIGPTPEIMIRMADKVVARREASEAGLPIVPGTDGDVEDKNALSSAETIGYPIMVKAAEGGGGIGIRLAANAEEMVQVIDRARSLAESAFGSSRIYLEKYIEGPAHIEIQVLGDNYGNVVHLFERDCSVQRRNQKVVEETPSLKVNEALLEEMTNEAVIFARSIGYVGAGTVEFIMDREGHFYFLEMNTRLQVEHGVTELVTGIDLVEQQLRVAAGEPLSISQEDIQRRGHSIEARIYPEDPVTFMPQAGIISRVTIPKGSGIRVDHALFPGYEVTPYYEPMVGKLMVWGKDRDEAILRMSDALQDLRLEGVISNIPLVQTVLREPSFIRGTYDTGLLSRMVSLPERRTIQIPDTRMALTLDADTSPEVAMAIAKALMLLNQEEAQAPKKVSGWKYWGRKTQLFNSQLERGSWRDR